MQSASSGHVWGRRWSTRMQHRSHSWHHSSHRASLLFFTVRIWYGVGRRCTGALRARCVQPCRRQGRSGHFKKATNDLAVQGYSDERIHVETFLNCRYHGTSTKLMIETPKDLNYGKQFYDEHKREFGFNLEGRNVLVDDLRVRATGKSVGQAPRSPYEDYTRVEKRRIDIKRFDFKKVYYENHPDGWLDSVLVPMEMLGPGDQVSGPGIVYDRTQTLLVEPGYIASRQL
jgi:N-methylhydantoinase A/oxoprolinase/acetone carboxylase beta subunit